MGVAADLLEEVVDVRRTRCTSRSGNLDPATGKPFLQHVRAAADWCCRARQTWSAGSQVLADGPADHLRDTDVLLVRADQQGTFEFRVQPHGLDTGCR